ncbi:MAG: SDR family NAD(P)-dependent oxidoreductase [Oscillospiraceae bacterium]|nr:SDR family NAD(P)-dependent oxidoreductase [Oscillospiraceae bacterium]
MKKAVVVGGSNGIGLALATALARSDRYVYILDRQRPDIHGRGIFPYIHCDLLDFNSAIVDALARDEEIDTLFITAGLGRVANFESLHPVEIDKLFGVNAVGAIKIIQSFYERIRSKTPFFCGLMGSIAGLVVSPRYSVYGATKAALTSFSRSLNIELEAQGFSNRLLLVAPGKIEGTRFHSNSTQLEKLGDLSREILESLYSKKELFIPKYDEIYKNVLEENMENPREFGLNSYKYKENALQADGGKTPVIGYMSGTFDLFHIGHLNIIKKAKAQCDYLIVGVHKNVIHKKRETYISYEERRAIVGAVSWVDKAVQACSEDSDAWEKYRYHRLFVGSDYKGSERFKKYQHFFEGKGVEIVFFPYTRSTSSTQLRAAIAS